METACPHCGKRYRVADSSAGKQARCSNPACRQTFIVAPIGQSAPPAAAGPAPAYPAVPTPPAAPYPSVPAAAPSMPAAPMSSGSPLDDLLAAEMGAGPPPLPGAPVAPGYPAAPGYAAPGYAAPGMSPLAPAPAYRRRRNNLPWIIGGAVGGGVLLIVLIVLLVVYGGGGGGGGPMAVPVAGAGGSGVASNGLPTWAAFAVPPGARAIGYGNIEKFRRGQLWKLFERLANQSGKVNAMQMMAAQAQLQNAKDAYIAMVDKDSGVVVWRVQNDMTLEAAASPRPGGPGVPPPAGPPKTHAGINYMSSSEGFVAKVAPSTFCTAKREPDLQAALDRFQRKEATPLSPELQLAMKSAQGEHYFAMTDINRFGSSMPSRPANSSMPDPKWLTAGISGDTTLQVECTVGFASAADAGRVKAEFDDGMRKIDQQFGNLPPQAPPQMRAMFQKILGMVRAIRLNQSGDTIRATASWQIRDIEELVNAAQGMGMGGGFPGMGPGPGF